MEMVRFYLLLFLIFGAAAGVTYFLHRVFAKNKFVKYFLPIAMFLAGLNNIYLSTKPAEGFEDIGRVIIAIILFTGSAAGLFSSLFLDFFLPKFKK